MKKRYLLFPSEKEHIIIMREKGTMNKVFQGEIKEFIKWVRSKYG